MDQIYKSAQYDWSTGKDQEFKPWVPAKGPTGRRNVIRGLLLHAVVDVDVATAAIQGEDLAKLFQRITIRDLGGVRWDLTGEESRLMAAVLLGNQGFEEHADVGTGNGTVVEFTLYIPFEKMFARRGYDFAIAADVFGETNVLMPTDGTLDIGTSAVTINSGTYKIWAYCREEGDLDKDGKLVGVEFKQRDVFKSKRWESDEEATIVVNGGYLAECFAYKTGASGGASMANMTAHQIEGIHRVSVDDAVMKHQYSLTRGGMPNGDGTIGEEVSSHPVRANQVRMLHTPPPDCKLRDLPFVAGSATVRATNSVTDPSLVYRIIKPKSASEAAAVSKLHGISKLRVKTAGKTQRGLGAWDGDGVFMPVVGA